MRKEDDFRKTVRIAWIRPGDYRGWIQVHSTVLITNLQKRNTVLRAHYNHNQNFENMTHEEIISEVENGALFAVNFTKRRMRLNGKLLDLSDCVTPPMKDFPLMTQIECLYELYKHSVPSERSESHRRSYFKALPEKSLTDVDMMFGEQREVARCRLELFVLLVIIDGRLTWHDEWGTWFYQSPKDKDFVILREWIEPRREVCDE